MARVEEEDISEEEIREIRETLGGFVKRHIPPLEFINELNEDTAEKDFESPEALKEKLFEAIEKGKREEAEEILRKIMIEVSYLTYLSAVDYAKAYLVYLLMTLGKETALKVFSRATYYRYLKELETWINQNYEDLRKALEGIREMGGIEGVSKCKSR